MDMNQNHEAGQAETTLQTPEDEKLRLTDVEVTASVKMDVGELHLADVNVYALAKGLLDLGEMSLADVGVNAPAKLDYLLKVLKAGAANHLLKDASRRELTDAVEQVLLGEAPLSSELATRLMELLRPLTGENKGQPRPQVEPLTPRQLDVLKLLARGRTNPEIAQELVLSTGTVRTHVQHIIARLGVSDRTGAVVRAIELGLITPESDFQGSH
jgi:ATP/maltotriose-dependent transcriptional regulator MalT